MDGIFIKQPNQTCFKILIRKNPDNLMKGSHSLVSKETKTPSFFIFIAIVGLLAVLIGFAKTFIIPTVEGNFKAPIIVDIHGAFHCTGYCCF